MAHSSIYEDFFVDQSIPHTVALVFKAGTAHDVVIAVVRGLEITHRSHITDDEHITDALYKIMMLSEDPYMLLDDDNQFEKLLLFVDCEDMAEFQLKYYQVRLAHYDALLGCLRFDREHRIQIGSFYDDLQKQLSAYTHAESLIGSESEPANLEEMLDRVHDELERLSPLAIDLIARLKL